MLPARTTSPPYFLMPRYFGFESRPLREEPAPFLCAMVASQSAERDVVDLHFREALPVSLLACVVLTALELEYDDLLAATVPHDLALHGSAVEHRNAAADVLAVGAQEHLIEGDLGAGVAEQRGEAICLARLDS